MRDQTGMSPDGTWQCGICERHYTMRWDDDIDGNLDIPAMGLMDGFICEACRAQMSDDYVEDLQHGDIEPNWA